MGRGVVAAAVSALLASGCGGGGSAPTMPGTTPAVPSKVVVLDAGSFGTLVLASARPSVVEFHSPT